MKRILAILLLMTTALPLFAREEGVEMADALYENGKIYVVVLCIVVILVGLFLYLFSIDRRIKKLENNSLTEK